MLWYDISHRKLASSDKIETNPKVNIDIPLLGKSDSTASQITFCWLQSILIGFLYPLKVFGKRCI